MKEKVQISGFFRIACLILAAIGVICFILGLRIDPKLTWGSYLVAAYYFIEIAVGAAFFLAIQYISQSGWSSAFRRVPEAIMTWIPFTAVFFLLLYFGIDIYHWSHEDAVVEDTLLQHKSAYLNIPFFFTRIIISFLVWSLLILMLRKLSLKEDRLDPADSNGILSVFNRSEMYAKILIFVLALTFWLSAFDWIM
jgi:hypothetical protein